MKTHLRANRVSASTHRKIERRIAQRARDKKRAGSVHWLVRAYSGIGGGA